MSNAGVRFDDDVRVVNKSEIKPVIRMWVGLLDPGRDDMVTRRSVIMHTGVNELEITWKLWRDGIAFYVALFKSCDAAQPYGLASVGEPRSIFSQPGNIVTLYWSIALSEGSIAKLTA